MSHNLVLVEALRCSNQQKAKNAPQGAGEDLARITAAMANGSIPFTEVNSPPDLSDLRKLKSAIEKSLSQEISTILKSHGTDLGLPPKLGMLINLLGCILRLEEAFAGQVP